MDPISLIIVVMLIVGVVWLGVRGLRASAARRAAAAAPEMSGAGASPAAPAESSSDGVMLAAREEDADGPLAAQGRELFELCGLTWVFHGEGTADQVFAAVAALAPIFEETQPVGDGLGRFGTVGGQVWTAGEGARGSYVAVHCFPDADSAWMLREIVMPTNELGGGAQRSMVMLGEAPAEFAHLYAASRAKPVWEFSGFSRFAPATFDASLREQLMDEGWQQVAPDVDMYRSTAPGSGEGRTQLVFIGMLRAGVYALYSPILEISGAGDGQPEIPDFLHEEDFGDYGLVPIADRAFLESILTRGAVPALEQIYSRAVELARFADECEARYSSEDLM